MERSSLQAFRREAPEVAAALDGMMSALASREGLDAKTRQLVYLGIRASQGDSGGAAAHAPLARAAGASRDEVVDAILLTLTVSGVQGVFSCLAPALAAYDGSPEARA